MVRSWLLAAVVLMSGCEGSRHSHLSQPGPSVEGASRTSVAEAPTSPAGPLTVPDVVGKKYNVAQVELASIGPDAWLEAVYRWVHEPAVPAGTVSAQSPPAGTMLANGSPVSLTISLGPDYVAGAPPCRASIRGRGQVRVYPRRPASTLSICH